MLQSSRKVWLSALVALAIAIGAWLLGQPTLPHVHIPDGGELRVYAITYTAGPSSSHQHNFHAPRLRWWFYDHLPTMIRNYVPEPDYGIGNVSSYEPMLSIWWGHIPPGGQKPELDEAGDVLLSLDNGQVVHLGGPVPYDDGPELQGAGLRQIVVTPMPTDSKRLVFSVPSRGQIIRFTIDNPAWRSR